MTIQLNSHDRIFAIGSNAGLVHFVNALLDAGIAPARIRVIADAARIAPEDQAGLVARLVRFEAIAETDFQTMNQLIANSSQTMGCVFGWHRIFPAATIALFKGRLFNLHAGDLPRYRGAGGGSWQVMNLAEHTAAHLHLMTRAVDKGAVFFSHQELVPASNRNPAGFKKAGLLAGNLVISQFVQAIASNACLQGRTQNELQAVYFPRLSTSENAVIDFDWTAKEIEAYIHAFGAPYSGAEFHYKDQPYRVLKAQYIDVGIDFHPFCHGLIVNTSAHGVHVACRGGVLIFNDIVSVGAAVSARHFRIGSRLWSSPDRLKHAKTFRPGVAKSVS